MLTSSVHQQLRSRLDACKLATSFHSTSFEQSNEVILVVTTFSGVNKVRNSEYK